MKILKSAEFNINPDNERDFAKIYEESAEESELI